MEMEVWHDGAQAYVFNRVTSVVVVVSVFFFVDSGGVA